MQKVSILSIFITFIIILSLAIACSSTTTPTGQVTTLKFSSNFNEIEDPGQFSKHFLDQVEQESNGRVKFQRNYGGVLGTPAEQLGLCKSGTVDVITFIHTMNTNDLPLHLYSPSVPDGGKKSVNFAQEMELENSKTAPLLQKEWADNNLKFLSYRASMENGFIARFNFDTLADLTGKKVCCSAAFAGALEKSGFGPVNVPTPDRYEGLSKGVCDFTWMGLDGIISLKFYEQTKCFASDNLYNYGAPIVVNLNTWNKLPPDMQKIFLEAAKSAREYSIKRAEDLQEQYHQTLSKAGIKIVKLSQKDLDFWFTNLLAGQKQTLMTNAEKKGELSQAQMIWQVSEELLGYHVP